MKEAAFKIGESDSKPEILDYGVKNNLLNIYGIDEGNRVYVQVLKENDEEQITVWEAEDTIYAGFASDNFGDILIMMGEAVSTFKKSEVKLIGKIVAVVKPFDARNFTDKA
jgi:proteasome assembly chaperone (PAC2) family protein